MKYIQISTYEKKPYFKWKQDMEIQFCKLVANAHPFEGEIR